MVIGLFFVRDGILALKSSLRKREAGRVFLVEKERLRIVTGDSCLRGGHLCHGGRYLSVWRTARRDESKPNPASRSRKLCWFPHHKRSNQELFLQAANLLTSLAPPTLRWEGHQHIQVHVHICSTVFSSAVQVTHLPGGTPVNSAASLWLLGFPACPPVHR